MKLGSFIPQGVLGSIAGYVRLSSENASLIIVYFLANYRSPSVDPLESIVRYVSLASENSYPIIVYFVANYRNLHRNIL